MPLDIKITERDNSVFNVISNWTNLVNETKKVEEESSSETREVLFEKHNKSIDLENQRKIIYKNWKNSGFLDGLHGYQKSNIVQLYENQASCFINDVNSPIQRTYTVPVGKLTTKETNDLIRKFSSSIIGVSSRSFDSKWKKIFLKIKSFFVSIWKKIFKKKKEETNFDGIVFPMIRQVFAQTIALDLVPVQPLSASTGMLNYFDYTFEREDVYSRIVLFEKYKPKVNRWNNNVSGSTSLNSIVFENDYFIPVRSGSTEMMMIFDGRNRNL